MTIEGWASARGLVRVARPKAHVIRRSRADGKITQIQAAFAAADGSWQVVQGVAPVMDDSGRWITQVAAHVGECGGWPSWVSTAIERASGTRKFFAEPAVFEGGDLEHDLRGDALAAALADPVIVAMGDVSVTWQRGDVHVEHLSTIEDSEQLDAMVRLLEAAVASMRAAWQAAVDRFDPSAALPSAAAPSSSGSPQPPAIGVLAFCVIGCALFGLIVALVTSSSLAWCAEIGAIVGVLVGVASVVAIRRVERRMQQADSVETQLAGPYATSHQLVAVDPGAFQRTWWPAGMQPEPSLVLVGPVPGAGRHGALVVGYVDPAFGRTDGTHAAVVVLDPPEVDVVASAVAGRPDAWVRSGCLVVEHRRAAAPQPSGAELDAVAAAAAALLPPR